MRLRKCNYFSLRLNSIGFLVIEAGDRITEDFDKSKFVRFVEIPSDADWETAATMLMALHTGALNTWIFPTLIDALAAWKTAISPYCAESTDEP